MANFVMTNDTKSRILDFINLVSLNWQQLKFKMYLESPGECNLIRKN